MQDCGGFGFRFRGGKGSHRIFVREGIREMLKFIKIIEKYNLLEEGDTDV